MLFVLKVHQSEYFSSVFVSDKEADASIAKNNYGTHPLNSDMQVFDIPYFNIDIALISLLKHELTEVEFCWANHVSVIQSW